MAVETHSPHSVPCAPIAATCREAPLDAPALDDGDDAGAFEVTDDLAPADAIDEVPFVCAPPHAETCDAGAHKDSGDSGARAEAADSGRLAKANDADAGDTSSLDPFATFARILEEVALTEGATPQAALFVRALLGEARTEGRALPPAVEQALVQGKLVTAGVRGLTRTPELCAQVVGWQGFLRGETDEIGAAASAMLDEWSADLLARVIGDPTRASAVRRELRARGVAAFGLVADAA